MKKQSPVIRKISTLSKPQVHSNQFDIPSKWSSMFSVQSIATERTTRINDALVYIGTWEFSIIAELKRDALTFMDLMFAIREEVVHNAFQYNFYLKISDYSININKKIFL